MADQDGALKATDVQLSAITVISPTGTSVSLLHVLTELNLFEDLFSSTMSGNILISDSLNLINKIPLIGSEYLVLAFEKPGSNVQLKKVFRIYKITDRVRTNQQNETYIIHFVSEELLLSECVLVSKSYYDQPISAIVQNIAQQYLFIDRSKFAPGSLQSTLGLHRIVIPSWHPLYAINWLSQRALSQYKGASFIWYEDREGYHFVSIESLMKQKSVQTIRVVPKNSGFERDNRLSDIQISQEGVETYTFTEVFDTLRSIGAGMYSSELIAADPLHRRIQVTTLQSPNFFQNTEHTNDHPFVLPSKDRLQQTLYEHTEAHRRVYPFVSAMNTTQRTNDVDKWMLQRDMYMANLHAIRLTAVLPGTLNLRVGKTVDIILPASEGQEKGGKVVDTLFSGKYIVTALRHKIDRKSYACIGEFSKDGLTKQLPAVTGLNSIDKLKGL